MTAAAKPPSRQKTAAGGLVRRTKAPAKKAVPAKTAPPEKAMGKPPSRRMTDVKAAGRVLAELAQSGNVPKAVLGPVKAADTRIVRRGPAKAASAEEQALARIDGTLAKIRAKNKQAQRRLAAIQGLLRD